MMWKEIECNEEQKERGIIYIKELRTTTQVNTFYVVKRNKEYIVMLNCVNNDELLVNSVLANRLSPYGTTTQEYKTCNLQKAKKEIVRQQKECDWIDY